MCKAFLPLMRGRGWGRVINIASATVAIASPVSIAYRTSKMGVIGFTRALSATLGDEGITINAVLPSLTRTAMVRDDGQVDVAADQPFLDSLLEELRSDCWCTATRWPACWTGRR